MADITWFASASLDIRSPSVTIGHTKNADSCEASVKQTQALTTTDSRIGSDAMVRSGRRYHSWLFSSYHVHQCEQLPKPHPKGHAGESVESGERASMSLTKRGGPVAATTRSSCTGG